MNGEKNSHTILNVKNELTLVQESRKKNQLHLTKFKMRIFITFPRIHFN